MPSRLAVRMILTAISPRLATRIFLNIRFLPCPVSRKRKGCRQEACGRPAQSEVVFRVERTITKPGGEQVSGGPSDQQKAVHALDAAKQPPFGRHRNLFGP